MWKSEVFSFQSSIQYHVRNWYLNLSRQSTLASPKVAEGVDGTYTCPGFINGRMHRDLICEPGDRVNCPLSYQPPISPTQSKPVSSLVQGYSWPLYPRNCFVGDLALSTTLLPGHTAIAPLDDSRAYYANYSTGITACTSYSWYSNRPSTLRQFRPDWGIR